MRAAEDEKQRKNVLLGVKTKIIIVDLNILLRVDCARLFKAYGFGTDNKNCCCGHRPWMVMTKSLWVPVWDSTSDCEKNCRSYGRHSITLLTTMNL